VGEGRGEGRDKKKGTLVGWRKRKGRKGNLQKVR